MSMQDVIRLCQQEQSVDYYTDKCTFESSVVQKPSALVNTDLENSDMV